MRALEDVRHTADIRLANDTICTVVLGQVNEYPPNVVSDDGLEPDWNRLSLRNGYTTVKRTTA